MVVDPPTSSTGKNLLCVWQDSESSVLGASCGVFSEPFLGKPRQVLRLAAPACRRPEVAERLLPCLVLDACLADTPDGAPPFRSLFLLRFTFVAFVV